MANLESTRQIGEAYFDVFNQRDLGRLDELLTDDFVSHLRVGDVEGLAAFKELMIGVYEAFPDMEWFCDEMICAPDRVVFRYYFLGTQRGPFLGIPPSGKFVRMEGAEVLHLRDGRIAEVWNYTDLMGMAARLNAINPLALEI